jgi:hypothetical protein
MNEFQYFYFPEIDTKTVRNALPDAEAKRLQSSYEDFSNWYNYNGYLFFYDQLQNHKEWLLQRFCRERGLKSDYLYDDEDQHRDFKDYCSVWGVDTHSDRLELWRNHHERQHGKGRAKVTARELFEEMERIYLHGERMGQDLTVLIPAWFNAQINNSAEEQKSLRAMPYAEYLKTSHWLRVRALTTFTFAATCIGKDCLWNMEGMWDSWGTRRHTHHISYKNRGNERFGDVCILCNECHSSLHKEGKDILDQDSINDFLERQWTKI